MQEGETDTALLLKLQVYKVAAQIYHQYWSIFPDQKYLLDNRVDDDSLQVMNDALAGNEEAMLELAAMFEKNNQMDACEFWKNEAASADTALAADAAEQSMADELAIKEMQEAIKSPSSIPSNSSTSNLPNLSPPGPYMHVFERWVPAWLRFLLQIDDGRLRLRMAINAAKLSALPLCLLIGCVFGQLSNPTFTTYASLHGSYGICWVLKSHLFPDQQWEPETSLYQVVEAFIALQTYFLPPILIAINGTNLHPLILMMITFVFTTGILLHFASDMQKSVALEHNPGHLIKDRLFVICRNPNYLGELLINLSFAMLTASVTGFLPVVTWLYMLWIPNLDKKEKSLARYEDWEAYKSQTKKLIPFCY